MKRAFLFLFLTSSIGELAAQLLAMETLHYVCKPVIIAALGGHYFFSTSGENRSRTVIFALLLSWLGDVLLLNADYFIGGLISFLLAHVLYILAYRQHQYEDKENALYGVQRIRLAFPIVLAGTGLVVVLLPVLGELKIPVMIYACVLVVMVLHSLFRYGRTNMVSFWMVFTGAVFFMASDSLLALDKFLMPVSFGGFWIMFTYTIAQYLIVKGLIRHE
jgi:uncharacterized membrane protein YhhN